MNGLNITNETKISSGKELLHSTLERLFFSETENYIGHLEKGSRIPDYFFEAATQKNALAINKEVKYLIQTYVPDLTLISVKTEFINTLGHAMALIITVETQINGEVVPDTLTFEKIKEI